MTEATVNPRIPNPSPEILAKAAVIRVPARVSWGQFPTGRLIDDMRAFAARLPHPEPKPDTRRRPEPAAPPASDLPDWHQDPQVQAVEGQIAAAMERDREARTRLVALSRGVAMAQAELDLLSKPLADGHSSPDTAALVEVHARLAGLRRELAGLDDQIVQNATELEALYSAREAAEAAAAEPIRKALVADLKKELAAFDRELAAVVRRSGRVGKLTNHLAYLYPGGDRGRGHARFTACGGVQRHSWGSHLLNEVNLEAWRKRLAEDAGLQAEG